MTDWEDSAACQANQDLPWLADTWEIPMFARGAAMQRMEVVCAACPVLMQCTDLAKTMTGGFWAGRDRGKRVERRVRRVVPEDWAQPSLFETVLEGAA